MILQSLCSYYERIAESPDGSVPVVGFSSEKVHFALVIGQSGELVQILDLREVKGKKKAPRSVIVPQGPKKSVNIAASFLWGSTSYVLGADDKDKPERTAKCHEAFKQLHRNLLAAVPDEGGKAVLTFLSSWKPEDATKLADWPEMLKGNLVFQLDGDLRFIHERAEMRAAWTNSFGNSAKGERGMCLVSGQVAPIARLHPAIRGVYGAQSSGAAMVSFNLGAFCSYGKDQNLNAPVSETNAFAYTTALNQLLASATNRIQIGDASTVFWTERASRSWIRYFLPARMPPSPLILRAICSIQGPLGWACRPRISTLRVATSMAKSTMQRMSLPLTSSSTEKKSHAAKTLQWLLINSFQVVLRVRSGSGSKPFSMRMFFTVVSPILYPRYTM